MQVALELACTQAKVGMEVAGQEIENEHIFCIYTRVYVCKCVHYKHVRI